MTVRKLFIGCDMMLEFLDVRDRDGAPVLDGTCTYTIKHKSGSPILDTGVMTLVAGGAPDYQKVIDALITSEAIRKNHYLVDVAFSNPAGIDDRRQQEYEAVYRE